MFAEKHVFIIIIPNIGYHRSNETTIRTIERNGEVSVDKDMS